MAKIVLEETYPCGYKLRKEISKIFSQPYFTDDGKGCPLHGMKCVKVEDGE